MKKITFEEFKAKAKDFWATHSETIIFGGISILASVAAAVLYGSGYRDGVRNTTRSLESFVDEETFRRRSQFLEDAFRRGEEGMPMARVDSIDGSVKKYRVVIQEREDDKANNS